MGWVFPTSNRCTMKADDNRSTAIEQNNVGALPVDMTIRNVAIGGSKRDQSSVFENASVSVLSWDTRVA